MQVLIGPRRTKNGVLQLQWAWPIANQGDCQKDDISVCSPLPKTFIELSMASCNCKPTIDTAVNEWDLSLSLSLNLQGISAPSLTTSPCFITKELSVTDRTVRRQGCTGCFSTKASGGWRGCGRALAEWPAGSRFLLYSHHLPSSRGSDGKTQPSPLGS